MRLCELFLSEGLATMDVASLLPRLSNAAGKWGRTAYGRVIDEAGLSRDRQTIRDWRTDQDPAQVRSLDRLRDETHDTVLDAASSAWVEDDFKDIMERELQDVTREHIEKQFGPIEPLDRTMRYDDQTKKNLYFLTHIIVHLDRTGKSPNDGYFQRSPNWADLTDHRYTQQHVDPKHDFGVQINIKAPESLRNVAENLIARACRIDLYGEDFGTKEFLDDFLLNIVNTFVHEVAHLEQFVRLSNAALGKINLNRSVMTYLPTPGTPRPRVPSWQFPVGHRQTGKAVKVGRRGAVEYRPRDTNGYDNYYGTSHEIDAHAAGTAADILSRALIDRARWAPREDAVDRQIAINQYVDDAIQDIKGMISMSGSIAAYEQRVRSFIPTVPFNAERAKADIGYRKVWRLFLTKLARHLVAHKKPIPWSDTPDFPDWRREYNPEPHRARVGSLVHPARRGDD